MNPLCQLSKIVLPYTSCSRQYWLVWGEMLSAFSAVSDSRRAIQYPRDAIMRMHASMKARPLSRRKEFLVRP